MKTLTLLTQKGGAGKTTLAASLAVIAANSREKVIALDLDPQGSLIAWANRRDDDNPLPANLTVERMKPDQLPRLKTILANLASKNGYTLAILDTAGVDNPATHIAIEASSLCLIPSQPTVIDLDATIPSYNAVIRLNRRAAFVLNRCPPHQKSARVSEATAALRIGLTAPIITARTDHQDAVAAGQGVTEYAAEGKAAQEITSLWRWLKKNLQEAV